MKTNIGGDRLGSGNKEQVISKHFERSTHDLSSIWRSSMACGTLVPFMSLLALPGDKWDINLNCEILTLPTVGPLFGSFKVQLDVFCIPMRLYNADLHMNQLGVGLDMSRIKLPLLELKAQNDEEPTLGDNSQVNPSSIHKYLGISGIGNPTNFNNSTITRDFNAIPYLAYWDIYKNYYANKQEERGFVIHADEADAGADQGIEKCIVFSAFNEVADIFNNPTNLAFNSSTRLEIYFKETAEEPDPSAIIIRRDGTGIALTNLFNVNEWNDTEKVLTCTAFSSLTTTFSYDVDPQNVPTVGGLGAYITLKEFPLENIDNMKKSILQHSSANAFKLTEASPSPYGDSLGSFNNNGEFVRSVVFSQEGLGLKTYQSDLFNNWIDTEWIDGSNGVNEVTSVDTTGDSFTIDALNLASKVYAMLNRIALSGGTYDDYLDAVYTHKRKSNTESPVYHGSLIKELVFQEVISNAEAGSNGEQPLGTLAGKGRLTQKHKGGKMMIKVDEPSYIMGLVSLTPRISYSQGNNWDMNLKTFDDFHKPDLGAIGFQDLITDQMAWQSTDISSIDGALTFATVGKQPAWINYMTDLDRVYGNFADSNKDMFMVNNRRFDINNDTGVIEDLTTYVDPSKFNFIFAQTELDAQNFWVHISKDITARRKMSAKVIPNL